MAKLNQIEVNGTTYDLQDKSIFTGTQSEVNSAISNGTIKEGDIVNITDDVSTGETTVLDTMEEIMANTSSGIGAGALAVKELNNSLGGLEFTIIDGKPQWKERGADSFSPFSSGKNQKIISFYPSNNEQIGSNWGGQTVTHTINYTGTCALAGFVINIGGMGGTAKYVVYVNDIEVYRYTCGSNKGDFNHGCTSFPVNKGDVVKMVGNGNSSSGYGYFTNIASLIVIE